VSTETVYDDAHTGDRWTYGLTHRPLALYHVPAGWIIGSDRPHPDFPVFGTVRYPRRLTPDEVARYELRRVPRPEAVRILLITAAIDTDEYDLAADDDEALCELGRELVLGYADWPSPDEITVAVMERVP